MFQSLRKTLIVASIFWTAGLLALMHLLSVVTFHAFPAVTRVPHHVAILLGIALMTVGVALLRAGLTRFTRLRQQLLAIRAHKVNRVEGPYPTELQPLIDDLNALLDDRDKAVARALATAGDLAHGLKTPLAVLRHDAERARAAGQPEIADAIDREVERMSRQVEYHLTRARAAASGAKGAAPVSLATVVEAVARTVIKLHHDRRIAFESNVGAALSVRVEREDLDEILGNLIDNAFKWAKSKVAVAAMQVGSTAIVAIEDDGPGIPEPDRAAALGRGVRLDEAAPGSGLGLAIVRDLVETYGGSIALDDSALGGVRATLKLPSGPLPPA